MAKEIINKMKIQHSEWEKIFANEASDKGLISKIHKQIKKLKIKKSLNEKMDGTNAYIWNLERQ